MGFMNIRRFILLVLFAVSIPKLSFAEKVFSFEGQVDFSKKEFNIVLNLGDKSSLEAKVQKTSETEYRFLLDIEHLKTPFFDLLSKVESSIEIIRGPENFYKKLGDTKLRGRVWSQYSLVNYKPIQELSGSFEVKDRRLHLTAFSFGSLNCNGYVDLIPPYKLDLVINLLDVGMKDFLNFWGAGDEYESSGAVSGEIRAFGALDHLMLKGNLESRHGFVQKLDYDIISLNIEGVYPHMQIAHSTISKSDGVSFTLDGPINLEDKANFKKQIKALMIAPLVSDSGSELEWTIKRLNPEGSGTTELKYRFQRKNALESGASAGDKIDMLGIERTRKF